MSININLLYYFKNLHRIVLMYHLLFNDSPIAGHVCSFQIFAIMNDGAGNILTAIAAPIATLHPE